VTLDELDDIDLPTVKKGSVLADAQKLKGTSSSVNVVESRKLDITKMKAEKGWLRGGLKPLGIGGNKNNLERSESTEF
jgi:hypothetical protein